MNTYESDWCRALFLGAQGENESFFEKMLLDVYRDHIYWRRNFHPEDPLSLDPKIQNSPGYLKAQSDQVRALYKLAADLKQSIPIYSPRYLGHMVNDTSMVSKLAYFLGLLYNPNNVSYEVSPVTTGLEKVAIGQLAKMVGYDEKVAGGHICSGGTVANLESIRVSREIKALAVTWASLLKKYSVKFDGSVPKDLTEFALCSTTRAFEVSKEIKAKLLDSDIEEQELENHFLENSYANLGESFWHIHGVQPPVIVVSKAAHYGWKKGARILGYGTQRLLSIDVDANFMMDCSALEDAFKHCKSNQIPISLVVGILGSTESGSVDPIRKIAELNQPELGFHFHIDGAWGAYLTSLLWSKGKRYAKAEEQKKYFEDIGLNSHVFDSLVACEASDSITVDPHKWGFMPYPAGCFVIKNAEYLKLVKSSASYTFDQVESDSHGSIGELTIEGSKPGAAAAMIAITHKVCPLERSGQGRLIEFGLQTRNIFLTEVDRFNSKNSRFSIYIFNQPQLNIVNFLVSAQGNLHLKNMNELTKRVYKRYRVSEGKNISSHDYFLSHTIVDLDKFKDLDFKFLSKGKNVEEVVIDDKQVYLLRSVFMNPLLIDEKNASSYISGFFSSLEKFLCGEEVKSE